jgi:crotonobetainyl-CoA:carnitine CoA-transferase CaiB-like acyl-CoA transferase
VHNEEVDRMVGEWLSRLTVNEAIARLRAADVPCAAVRTPQEAIRWPQLHARDMVRPLRRPDGQATSMAAAGMPLKFSDSLAHHDQPAPVPGAHTAEILERFLGLDAQEIAALRADGIV